MKNTILTIAGSDSGGGAGIQADIKTITILGGFATSVIVALTAQNTCSITGIEFVSPDFIRQQFNAVVSDFDVKAVKTGMLPNIDTIEVVADCIKKSNIKYFVLDPVMQATSGNKLITENTSKAIKELLFPLANVITPNIPEAEFLADMKIRNISDMKKATAELLELGANAVILKGGHLDEISSEKEKIVDVCMIKGAIEATLFESKRVHTKNTHGTGCTLSAALATFLAQDISITEALYLSKQYLNSAIIEGRNLELGKGAGPLWHNIYST